MESVGSLLNRKTSRELAMFVASVGIVTGNDFVSSLARNPPTVKFDQQCMIGNHSNPPGQGVISATIFWYSFITLSRFVDG